jgi:hypothetical protein
MPYIASIIYKEYGVSLYCRDLFLVLCVVSCRVVLCYVVLLCFFVFCVVNGPLTFLGLVLSCLFFSYFFVLSCLASSCLVLSWVVLFCLVVTCRIVSLVLSCPILSSLVLSSFVLRCVVLSCGVCILSIPCLSPCLFPSFSSRHVLRDACSSKTCYTGCAWRGTSGRCTETVRDEHLERGLVLLAIVSPCDCLVLSGRLLGASVLRLCCGVPENTHLLRATLRTFEGADACHATSVPVGGIAPALDASGHL